MTIQQKITRKGYLETHLLQCGRDRDNITKNLQNVMLNDSWFNTWLRQWRMHYRRGDSFAVTNAKDIQRLNLRQN